jgi:hypothetical protein
MERFKCEKCDVIFENEGVKIEYTSPVYGPCSKKVADCPDCGEKSDEYRAPKRIKSKSYKDAVPSMGGCPPGGCCARGR